MASAPSAPPAPDYTGAAQATAAGNAANLQQQTVANRPNQTTPWGSSTWTQAPTGADGSPGQWSQQITLSPAEQQALNSQQAIQQNQSSLAQGLQGQVASTMANGFNAPSMSSYFNNVPSVNTNFSSFNPTGVGNVNQSSYNPNMYTRGNESVNQTFQGNTPVNTNFTGNGSNVNTNLQSSGQNINTNAQGAVAPAGQVNLNTPTFSSADAQNGAQAAYQAQVGLLQPQMQQDTTNLDASLRLQGLTPGTEAYNNAAQNLSRTQAQTLTQAANQAVQTGNNEANQNYQSQLAGYNANLGAQNQAYSQNANTFQLGNSALGQQYSQDANTTAANNTAIGQAYNQNLGAFNANNAASNQAYTQNLGSYNATNTARTQALNNSLSQYQAALSGQSAQNQAQNQAYTQALAGYGANQTALQNANQAQAQQYGQQANQFQTAYSTALQNYLQPLNSMNAVLSGNQVQSPSMPSFASAGYTPGADYSGAASATGQYNSGLAAQGAANASSTNGMIAGLGGSALMAAAMF